MQTMRAILVQCHKEAHSVCSETARGHLPCQWTVPQGLNQSDRIVSDPQKRRNSTRHGLKMALPFGSCCCGATDHLQHLSQEFSTAQDGRHQSVRRDRRAEKPLIISRSTNLGTRLLSETTIPCQSRAWDFSEFLHSPCAPSKKKTLYYLAVFFKL